MDTNKVIVSGYVRDKDFKERPDGVPYIRFILATAKNFKHQDEPTMIEIPMEAWGKPAKIVHEFLTSDKHVLIEGRLRSETGATADRAVSIVANFINFL